MRNETGKNQELYQILKTQYGKDQLINLIDKKIGIENSIPQLIMAGASVDDIFVIVLFTAFTGLAKGTNLSAMSFLQIPVSIIMGILI